MKKNIVLLIPLLILVNCSPEYRHSNSTEVDQRVNKEFHEAAPRTQPEDRLYYIRGTYFFSEIPVSKGISAPPLIETIGSLLADMLIKVSGSYEIKIEPYYIDLSEIDSEVVKDIRIDSVQLEIENNPSSRANLRFIKEINIKGTSQEGDSISLLTYRKTKEEACGNTCISFTASDQNFMKSLTNYSSIYIIPEIKIDSVPKESFTIKGSIKLRVGIKL